MADRDLFQRANVHPFGWSGTDLCPDWRGAIEPELSATADDHR
jgi:hypothetical protein